MKDVKSLRVFFEKHKYWLTDADLAKLANFEYENLGDTILDEVNRMYIYSNKVKPVQPPPPPTTYSDDYYSVLARLILDKNFRDEANIIK